MAAVDRFVPKANPQTDKPATGGEAVTPHDTNELTYVSRALWIGSTGNLKVTMADGQELTFNSVPVGWMPLRVKKVFSTGTTAANIVAVY